jgi:hypothetical protein
MLFPRPADRLPQVRRSDACNRLIAPCGDPARAHRVAVVGISNCSSEEQSVIDGVEVIVPMQPAGLRVSIASAAVNQCVG